uniref:Glutathione S-transferase e4 n=1 Tax=Lissorhoptrus oryzophilus TaxID=308863 RepID=A0A2R4FXI7_9CUCU|nr:glutathione S-transferase e4 [Lissorhoptrus oryzophilus]
MAPKLYGYAMSPPVRAVLMCAKALDITLEMVQVNLLTGEHRKDDFLKKNPQHTVPVLEDEDGFIVYDSHVINEYLVIKYGENKSLYPLDDLKQRTIINQRLYFEATLLFPRGFVISKALIFANIKPTKEKLDELKEAYQMLESIFSTTASTYVAGNTLSIADFSLTAALTTADVFASLDEYPQIKEYLERVKNFHGMKQI